jgi:hypothetical protein
MSIDPKYPGKILFGVSWCLESSVELPVNLDVLVHCVKI